jgi:hypothetical protein
MQPPQKTVIDTDPPSPKDFANWFDKNNSVDLRSLLRDIEIVLSRQLWIEMMETQVRLPKISSYSEQP